MRIIITVNEYRNVPVHFATILFAIIIKSKSENYKCDINKYYFSLSSPHKEKTTQNNKSLTFFLKKSCTTEASQLTRSMVYESA